MYAGQLKVAKDIERKLKKELQRSGKVSQRDNLKSAWYYMKLKKKNKFGGLKI